MIYKDDHGQQVELFVQEGHKNILCTLSGGADSSFLAWWLVTYCQEHIPDAQIHFATLAYPRKKWSHAKTATRVLMGIVEHTGSTQVADHLIFYREKQTPEIIQAVEKDYVARGLATQIYGATTQNPDVEELNDDDRAHYRDAGHNIPLFKENSVMGNNATWHYPFAKVDKRMIAHLYEVNDLGWLFDLTRSCEKPYVNEGHCGECWWCRERKWAFNRI